MMFEIVVGCLFGGVVLLVLGIVGALLSRKTPVGGVVEQYRLVVDRSDAFAKVLVTFETDKGRATYEFAPAYAYVLSNELCRISVQSAPRDERKGEGKESSDSIVLPGLPPEGEL